MSHRDAGYWEARLAAHYNLCGVGHESFGLSYNQWLYEVRAKIFARCLAKANIDAINTKVLDIGSGTGFYIDCWEKAGATIITGSDITSVAVRNLHQIFARHQFVQLDISTTAALPISGPFDCITAFDVLYHITDDAGFSRAMSNIHRLLAPHGWFVFSDNFIHKETVRGQHQASRSLQVIEGALGSAGFRCICRLPMFILMNSPVDTRRHWPLALWKSFMLPLQVYDTLGYLGGAFLASIDLILTKFLSESPTTEIMLCKRIADCGG